MQFKHILAPTDFSDYSKKAVATALDLARTFGAKLTVLHVVEFQPYLVPEYVPPTLSATWPTFLDDLERQATQDLANLPESEAGDVEVARLVADGSPHRRIIETAAAQQVDLIVLATAGRSGLGRLFMGSVAERVVRGADCPVLTMRPRE